MVLHCAKYPEIRKTCWKDVGAALPWRPYKSVLHRAHVLFGRSETRSWTKGEEEIISKYHKEHRSDWRTLGDVMGKHRVHVKDSGRIKLPNMKKGHWSQDEDHTGENISWDAVSQKLSTRTNMNCCLKWYNQLASPMVKEGQWEDADDYRLLNSLVGLDACSMEEVDWDCLIENRSGELCRKRWTQMVKQMSEHGKKSFVEQVDIISERYCPDLGCDENC
ncbi:hypothetical protein SAY87_021728 [Trapa incisa]|uniref:Myb-like domain-containing protein n=1 Tax=Trapa incisa TaxID=236973 RepID=A0AAN7PWN9_9MYRT|nr:hypothetical protein SAY87_021728 [Trapa incisa]